MAFDVYSGIDFANPLTQALFDRTPEQRQRHGQLVVQHAGVKGADQIADRTMYDEFLADVDVRVRQKIEVYVSDAVQQGPSVDQTLCASLAVDDVRREIALLHAALPLPMIDRMADA